MNETDNTKQVWHGILLLKCLHLPKPAQQNDKLSKTSTSTSKHQTNYHTNFVSRLNSH